MSHSNQRGASQQERFNQLSFPGSADLSVFQAGDTANYGSNSHGHRKELSGWGVRALTKRELRRKMPPTFSEKILEFLRVLPFLREYLYNWPLKIWKHPFLYLTNSCVICPLPPIFLEMEFSKYFLLVKHYLIRLS